MPRGSVEKTARESQPECRRQDLEKGRGRWQRARGHARGHAPGGPSQWLGASIGPGTGLAGGVVAQRAEGGGRRGPGRTCPAFWARSLRQRARGGSGVEAAGETQARLRRREADHDHDPCSTGPPRAAGQARRMDATAAPADPASPLPRAGLRCRSCTPRTRAVGRGTFLLIKGLWEAETGKPRGKKRALPWKILQGLRKAPFQTPIGNAVGPPGVTSR
jgi:hypothetical protein